MTHDSESDPAAVIELPTEDDVEVLERLLERMYEGVAYDYERLESDEMPWLVAQRGSLYHEIMAQLANQDARIVGGDDS